MFAGVSTLSRVLFVGMLAIMPCLWAGASTLDEDFEAMAAYEFGMSRAPLQRIADMTRAALAERAESGPLLKELEAGLVSVLDNAVHVESKRFALRLLSEISGEASARAAFTALQDEALFNVALTALESMDGAVSGALLVEALTHFEGERRVPILAALGRQGATDTVSVLGGYGADESDVLAVAAADALARLGDAEACAVLAGLMETATPARVALFADPCLQCADALFGVDVRLAERLLGLLCAEESPAHVRLAAIRLSMQMRPEKAGSLLMAALEDADPALASDALLLARHFEGAEITDALILLLDNASDMRKPALLDVLAQRGDARALAAVRGLLDHDQADIRRAALRAVGVLGDASLIRMLLERASAGPMEEQRIARAALARLADPATNARLLDFATGRGEAARRVRAVALLAERRAADAAPALLALAARAPAEVRAEAVRALRVLATPEMMDGLLRLTEAQAFSEIAEPLPQTLSEVAARIPDPERRADAIVAGLAARDDETARAVLIDALGLVGGENAFEAVRAALRQENVAVRRAAVAATVRFQRSEALEELLDLAMNDSDDALRARAYSAHLQLLRAAGALDLKEVNRHLDLAFRRAGTAAERREWLAAATHLPSLAGLRMVESMMDDPEVTAEAARAALRVSIAIVGAWPEEARPRLEQFAALEGEDAMSIEARAALEMMRRFDGHIMTWEMSGPYFEEHVMAHALFEQTFPPERDAQSASWRLLTVLPDADPPYALELDRVVGGEERVIFLRTRVQVAEKQNARLEIGTNDGCRVWWNGELIHSLNTARPLTPGEDRLDIVLEPGWNTLMLAVFQHGAAWRATARVVTPEGAAVDGLIARPGHAEEESAL